MLEAVQTKERVIQEYVPGKQITLAHLIANPNKELYKKLGLNEAASAIGILTITPSEGAIIASDVATKSGAVIITGDVSAVEYALRQVIHVLGEMMKFTPCSLTRT